MKANGIIIPSFLLALAVSGFIGFGALKSDVKNTVLEIEEVKDEADKIEEKHNDDVKDINGKLATITNLIQSQSINIGKMETNVQYIQRDVAELRKK